MPAEQFRIDYALSLAAGFAKGGHGKGFARIDRQVVADGLRARIEKPVTQNQAAASLCGPAALFYCLLEEHPELYAQYVIDLFNTGEARIKSLHVKPSAGCRAYQPPPDKIHAVDWIALASLRNSENTLLDYSSADDTAARNHLAAYARQMVSGSRISRRQEQYELLVPQGAARD